MALPPDLWPSGIPFRPLRACGAFVTPGNQALSEIQIRIGSAGGQSVEWYFNDFFKEHPDRVIFERYFAGGALPTGYTPIPTAPPQYVPGAYPPNPNTNSLFDVLFSLDRVRCSSRYGGTMELVFRLAEEYEYEARKNSTLWDLPDLELRLYVVPNAAAFNVSNVPPSATVRAELSANTVQAYMLSPPSAGNVLTPIGADTVAGELNEILAATATRFIQAYSPGVSFVYGHIHAAFQASLQTNDVVDMVELRANFLDLHTRTTEWHYTLDVRLNEVNLNTEPGDEEIEAGIFLERFRMLASGSSTHLEDDFSTFSIDDDDGTGWTILGPMRLDTCIEDDGYLVQFSFVEEDSFVDDIFKAVTRSVSVSCRALLLLAEAGESGVVSQVFPDEDEYIEGYDEVVEGSFTWLGRVRLMRR